MVFSPSSQDLVAQAQTNVSLQIVSGLVEQHASTFGCMCIVSCYQQLLSAADVGKFSNTHYLYMLPNSLWYFSPELGPSLRYSNVVPTQGVTLALGGKGQSLRYS